MKPHIPVRIDPMPPRNGILVDKYNFDRGRGVSGQQGVDERDRCGSGTDDQIVTCKLSSIHF